MSSCVSDINKYNGLNYIIQKVLGLSRNGPLGPLVIFWFHFLSGLTLIMPYSSKVERFIELKRCFFPLLRLLRDTGVYSGCLHYFVKNLKWLEAEMFALLYVCQEEVPVKMISHCLIVSFLSLLILMINES